MVATARDMIESVGSNGEGSENGARVGGEKD